MVFRQSVLQFCFHLHQQMFAILVFRSDRTDRIVLGGQVVFHHFQAFQHTVVVLLQLMQLLVAVGKVGFASELQRIVLVLQSIELSQRLSAFEVFFFFHRRHIVVAFFLNGLQLSLQHVQCFALTLVLLDQFVVCRFQRVKLRVDTCVL